MAWGKLYRRAFLLENGLEFCEGILNEDELFSVEAACLAESMYCLPDIASYIYRVRQGSIMTASRYEKRRESCERMLDHMYGFLRRHSLAGDAVCGDLLSYLFSYANEVSWRYSAEEYLKQYGKYRKIVSRRYGERLASDRRLKAVLRDLHFLLPACIGSRVFKFQNRLR